MENVDKSIVNLLTGFKDLFSSTESKIKFFGNLVLKKGSKIITSVTLCKYKGRLLFAKGFSSAQEVKEHIKPDTKDKIFFVVPLFNKKMFGHFRNEMENEKICLVSWEFSLNWFFGRYVLLWH